MDQFVVSAGFGGIIGAAGRLGLEGAAIRSSAVPIGTTVYRVFGGASKLRGAFWTTVNPATIGDYASAAGLPASNTAQYMATGTVIDSTNAVTGLTRAAAAGQAGGLAQVVVEATQVIVNSVETLP
jgi:hypothetical protein